MSFDFEKRVRQYVMLRDKIRAEDDAHKERMQPMRDALDQLNGHILGMLNATHQENAKTQFGTAYRKTTKSATIADMAAFRRHVIGTEAYDLVDWRANAKAIAAFIEETNTPPPGVNFMTHIDVGVRRANGKEE